MIDVITFRGTTEPQNGDRPVGMLRGITDLLDQHPDKFRCIEPTWPASIGPVGPADLHLLGPSLDTTVAQGVEAGRRAIRDSPNVCGLLGYSLGAICTSRILEAVRQDRTGFRNANGTRLQIAFVVNLANPLRRRGDSVGNLCPPDRFGLHGEHGAWPALDVREYANPHDIITCSPANSPLRVINAGISPFSLIEGGRVGDVLTALALLAASPIAGPLVFETLQGVISYLSPHGDHVLYGEQHFPGSDRFWTQHAADYLIGRY